MGTAPSSTLPNARPVDPARALETAEHVAAVLRLRAAVGPGWLLWMASIAFDFGNAANLAPGSLSDLVLLRFLGGVIVFVTWMAVRAKRRPTPAGLRAMSFTMFTSASAIFGAMAVAASGITSPYFGGAMIVLVVYGVVVCEPWRRGLVGVTGAFVGYPGVIGAAAAFSPAIAVEFRDPVARTIFFANVGNLFLASIVVVISGHFAWRLRRQVFEARSLGRYKLKKRIGAGGMGEVWAAHHTTLKRDVAVKILGGDLAVRDSAAVLRFEREVRATTELAHPNTVRVFDYGVTDDGVSFYAMELLEGETLATTIARDGPLPPARAIHLMLQAARALAEAHGKGIVHRDVKPENLFLVRVGDEHDFVKVLDFGIAQLAGGGHDPRLTQTGSLVGTPAWLSPEAVRGEPIDARADVYAIGAVLYFALAGKPPFDFTNPALVLTAHLHDRPEPPSQKRGSALPADLEAIVMRCLGKEPAERFATARELADALDACGDAGNWTRADAEAAWAARGRLTPSAAPYAETLVGPATG